MVKQYSTCVCLFIPDGPEIYSFGRDITPGYAWSRWARIFGWGIQVVSPRDKPLGHHVMIHAGKKIIWQRWFYR